MRVHHEAVHIEPGGDVCQFHRYYVAVQPFTDNPLIFGRAGMSIHKVVGPESDFELFTLLGREKDVDVYVPGNRGVVPPSSQESTTLQQKSYP